MNIREFYGAIGSDFEAAKSRMLTERLMDKLVRKFADDRNFQRLSDAISAKDGKEAFEAAHTLKGLALNLGFDRLGKATSEITEKLRSGEIEGAEPLLGAVREAFDDVMSAIGKLDPAS